MFISNPFDSRPFFHTAIFLSNVSAKITRSSARSISHGHPTRNSRESAFRTVTQPAFPCSKLTIETLEQSCEICSKLTFIVNSEYISHLCSSVSIVNFEHVIADWETRKSSFLCLSFALLLPSQNNHPHSLFRSLNKMKVSPTFFWIC